MPRGTRPILLAFLFLLALAPKTVAADAVNFLRDIRPILSETCFQCHGPDEKHRKADLRLDRKDGAFADLGGYQAIVAGKPGESALYKRIASKDPKEQMPPPKSGKKLTPQQIELVRRWIEQG